MKSYKHWFGFLLCFVSSPLWAELPSLDSLLMHQLIGKPHPAFQVTTSDGKTYYDELAEFKALEAEYVRLREASIDSDEALRQWLLLADITVKTRNAALSEAFSVDLKIQYQQIPEKFERAIEKLPYFKPAFCQLVLNETGEEIVQSTSVNSKLNSHQAAKCVALLCAAE